MTEKLELQPNEPLSMKVERHRAVYLAAINGEGGANMDQEAKARMEIIRHAPSDPDERDQKMLYVAGYLIAAKGSLNPEEWSFFFQAPLTAGTLTSNRHLAEISSWWQPTRRMLTLQNR